MRLWALRNRVRDLFGLAPLPPPHGAPVPPTPRVRVELAGAVPGAVVRLAPGVVALVVAGLAGCAAAGWVLWRGRGGGARLLARGRPSPPCSRA